jgi:type I restriction enzyme, S subunit
VSAEVLPKTWKQVTLGKVATLQRGYDLPVQERRAGTVPIYAANGQIGFHDAVKVHGPGVVTGRSGSIGKVHFVEQDFWPLNTSLYVKDFHGNDPKFVTYLLRHIGLDRFSHGVGVPTLDRNIAHQFPVRLPPLPEQKRIAAILDKADAIRRKRQEAIRLTEELLRSANDRKPGKSRKVIHAHGPFWKRLTPLGVRRQRIAVLGIDNAVKNRFAWGERRFITEDKYERLKRYTVYPRDVIVTIMGTTGRTAVVPDDIPLAITTKHLATITLNPEAAEAEFVAQALHRHPAVLSQIENAHRGAIMSGLNLGLIKALQLRVPPVREQRNFASLTAAVRRTESRMRDAEAKQLSDGLTQLAFTGGL